MKGRSQSAPSPAQQPDRHGDVADLLTQVQVCRRLGICDESWRRWRQAGRTPEAVTLPSGRLKWRVEDIDRLAHTPASAPVSRYFQSAHRGTLRAVETNRTRNTVPSKSVEGGR